MARLFRPRIGDVQAEQNSGKNSDMYRLAAWVLDNKGFAWIKDNYENQGPDMLHIRNSGGPGTPVVPGEWVVLSHDGNFEVISNEKFQEKYESDGREGKST